MKLRAALALLVPLVVLPASAHADELADRTSELRSFDYAMTYYGEQGLGAASHFKKDAADCLAVVAKLKALGMAPTELIQTREAWLFKRAPEKCEAYRVTKLALAAHQVLAPAWNQLDHIKHTPVSEEGSIGAYETGIKMGKACLVELDALVKGGLPATTVIKLAVPGPLAVADARAQICEAMIPLSEGLAAQAGKATGDRAQAAREKYAKHGAAGDKLEWLLYYDPDGAGKNWYLPPKCEATDDAARLAKAKVLIMWGVNDDGTQVLRKLTFKGNKKVKDQEKTFPTEAKAYKFCK